MEKLEAKVFIIYLALLGLVLILGMLTNVC